MPVDPITDENTFPDKNGTRPVPTGKNPANYTRGVDLNKLKARLADHAVLLNALEEALGELDEVGTGDVVGPASSGDGEFALFDGLTGKLIKRATGVTLTGLMSTLSEIGTNLLARVVGPSSSADGEVALFDALTGKLLKGAGFTGTDVFSGLTTAATTQTALGLHVADDDNPHSVTAVQAGALPAPGGTTIAGGIVTGSGTAGAAVEVSTTTLAVLLDALAPTVQTTHTAATKTLAAGDAGQVIPLSGASNAIAITVPHTLFASAGAGRAFVCQFKVLSVAGGALTFVGSGGIVITYSGKNPGTSAYAAGDYLTLVVDSATTARVFAAAAV